MVKTSEASRAYSRNWYAKNRDQVLESNRQRRKKYYHHVWAVATIYNHVRKDMIVEFDVSWLEAKALSTPCCELCGGELRWEPSDMGRGLHPDTPTLDRLCNEKILTIDNIMILCNSCNAGKGAQSLDEYIDKCTRIAHKFKVEMI